MIKKVILTLALSTGLLFIANGQNKISVQKNLENRIQDKNLGISFAKVGNVVKQDSITYRITLTSSSSYPPQTAIALVTTSNRLFVDLPGSYGGRLYFNSPAGTKFLRNRILADSVNNGHQIFHREYWAVYAGMGMWDCVINNYFQNNGKYYIVSLVQDKQLGKPGEISNGKTLTNEGLKLKALASLQDTTNNIVNEYNKLISSFHIENY